MRKNVEVIQDEKGTSIVQINQILFRGKQHIDWESVETYIKQFVGEFYTISETEDIVYIGKELPDEYTNSDYSKKLKGALAKAKANAAQAIPELIEFSTNGVLQDNFKKKHDIDAKHGWYRFDTRFAIPICNDDGIILKYNVFRARVIIRCAKDGKKYLYDVVNIKKETEYTA